ncbi:radical SAM family heme chaperone HemW [Actinomyces bouchesdurhonensis]|uniref:radical SAM family heme chaperone HemW n=1 Tax=Actinomyces bouchesdurhonensis TaxID=1852361 RepID=UPI0023F4D7E9|nr:radical SAM family heme chaperone HemW [Actinomyces bouchesdurhonensis]
MSPAQPDGMRWPDSGSLDPGLVEAERGRPLSLYVHVPFCRVRCGYCDFNTYTVGFGPGAQIGDYAPSVLAEADLAARVLADAGVSGRLAQTVFFGGGTPTMLDAGELIAILDGLRERIGIAGGAEVTLEANPDTVTREDLRAFADSGFTRVSFGMQSAVPRILAILDRTHTPKRVPLVVEWAKEAGLSTSVDLIYGTPGESLADWETSVRAALSYDPDHISAYALVVEEGTKMGAQVARGELPTPDPDDEAAKYELVDELLGEAGYAWYEISNFARASASDRASGRASTTFEHASRHNLAYWRDWDWWGFGPGAHSHVGRMRWWNVKNPGAYAGRLRAGVSPAAAGEILGEEERELERVMLGLRTAEGVELDGVPAMAMRDGIVSGLSVCQSLSGRVASLISDGFIDGVAALDGRAVLTLRGRLLADYVTRELMGY